MKVLVGAFNQEKALVGAFSVIVKTGCETDGSFYSTSDNSCSGMSADLFGYRAVQSSAGVAGRHSSLQTSAVSPPCLKRLLLALSQLTIKTLGARCFQQGKGLLHAL